MNYVIINLERSGKCAPSMVCSFSYVLCDLNFKIIESNEYVINPESEIECRGLRLSHEEYYNGRLFSNIYDKLANLLRYNIVLGFFIAEKARCINASCKKYNLEYINYMYYDIAKIYKSRFKVKGPITYDILYRAFGFIEDEHESEVIRLYRLLRCMSDALDTNLTGLSYLSKYSSGNSFLGDVINEKKTQ